ncbi:Uncharacterised protein [Candidatus Tiddalikarchaeum anstoanum]|nr:Uncharacterised protein [Candidatus Tiddalikarchaeum anstoanum]
MKDQSGFDLKVIIHELSGLVGARINKFYNTEDGELLIKLYDSKNGKIIIRVLKGSCMHLTQFDRENSEMPSNFTMLMRKYMNEAVITSIEQPSFERIAIIKARKMGAIYNIIIELFNKGNIVVCNEKMIIINALRTSVNDRLMKPNEEYALPKPRFQDAFLDPLEFKRIIKTSKQESLVKSAAMDLGLGGKYAEELCRLSNADKMKNPGFLSQDELDKLYKVFFTLYNSVSHYQNIKPCIIKKENKLADFAPFPLKSYEGADFVFFKTFNEACDYYYSNIQKQDYEDENKKEFENKMNRLTKRLSIQEEGFKEIERKIEECNKVGELIYANYDLIDTVLSKIKNANKNNISWPEIKKMVNHDKETGSPEANIIKSINENDNTITFEINDQVFFADLNSEAKQVAADYFDKAKKMRGKTLGSENSINETRKEIEELNNEGLKKDTRVVERVKENEEWFNKYSYIKTSSGLLFVSGRDATQNEVLVKKVGEDNDLIFHAEIQGSPFGILKNGLHAPGEDKLECAEFIAAHSNAWKMGLSVNVFAVKKDQVSKTAPSGEYVAHGAFVIKGEREVFENITPKICIGYNKENKIISGPKKLISTQCENYAELVPGNIESDKIAKRIQAILGEKNANVLSVKLEIIQRLIPGGSRIIQEN